MYLELQITIIMKVCLDKTEFLYQCPVVNNLWWNIWSTEKNNCTEEFYKMMTMIMEMNYFCGMIEWRIALSLPATSKILENKDAKTFWTIYGKNLVTVFLVSFLPYTLNFTKKQAPWLFWEFNEVFRRRNPAKMSWTYHRAISVFAVPCTSKKYAICRKSWPMLSRIISSFSSCAVIDSY